MTLAPLAEEGESMEDWLASATQRCGGEHSGRGRILSYLHESDGPFMLNLSTILPEGESSTSISLGIQRGCGENASTLFCKEIILDERSQSQLITVPFLTRGEYLLTLNEAPLERWESRYSPIDLPSDPQEYVATDDITSICWQDGGEDSFDCMGRVRGKLV